MWRDLYLEIECTLPFQVFAVCLAIAGVARDWPFALFLTGAITLLSTPMFIVRAFDPGRREMGVRYFLLHELAVLLSVLLILSVRPLFSGLRAWLG